MLPCVSRIGLPSLSTCGTPALRKYLLTMMSVASCDQLTGISASFISKTIDPSGLVMRLVRFSYATQLRASWPCLENRREIFIGHDPSQLNAQIKGDNQPWRRFGRSA